MKATQTSARLSAAMIAAATSPEDAGQALPFTCVCPYRVPCSALDKPQVSLFILLFSKR
jgi:hypothetical protein